jgi:PKD repeat protein
MVTHRLGSRMPRLNTFRLGAPRRPTRSGRPDRGQSMVEFALVLPVLLLLTLIALDFGRVYLGWINLQNMSRIAANYAANNPTAWKGAGDATIKLHYKNQILADAAASNCDLPKVGGATVVPAPTFTDANGNGTPELGDTASVAIACKFGVITPVISSIVGGQVNVAASSVFPVKAGMTAPGPQPTGSAPNAAFIGNGTINTTPVSGSQVFVVQFRDTSGGSPTGWSWNFGGGVRVSDGSLTATVQDPLDVAFTALGSYTVTMTATNAFGSSGPVQQTVTVTAPNTVDFTSNPSPATINAGQSVTFTAAASPGGTAYDWNYGDGTTHGTTATVTHTYNSVGAFNVTLTVTYPSGPVSRTKNAYVNVSVASCQVPSFNGVKRNAADNLWHNAPANFTGNVINGPGAPGGNGWTILRQSLTALSFVPCNSDIVVNNP